MNIEKPINKYFVDSSKLSVAEMNKEINKWFQDMFVERTTPEKKAFLNIKRDYGLEDYHVKEER
ncbi:MAG: hypothetical protein RSE56_03405 [Bacilli bacterium]